MWKSFSSLTKSSTSLAKCPRGWCGPKKFLEQYPQGTILDLLFYFLQWIFIFTYLQAGRVPMNKLLVEMLEAWQVLEHVGPVNQLLLRPSCIKENKQQIGCFQWWCTEEFWSIIEGWRGVGLKRTLMKLSVPWSWPTSFMVLNVIFYQEKNNILFRTTCSSLGHYL